MFVNTRALLQDFSVLGIQLLRFGIAWGVLKAASLGRDRSAAEKFGWKDEALFAGMGLSGV